MRLICSMIADTHLYQFLLVITYFRHKIGVNDGLEPPSPALTVQRSIQLS